MKNAEQETMKLSNIYHRYIIIKLETAHETIAF